MRSAIQGSIPFHPDPTCNYQGGEQDRGTPSRPRFACIAATFCTRGTAERFPAPVVPGALTLTLTLTPGPHPDKLALRDSPVTALIGLPSGDVARTVKLSRAKSQLPKGGGRTDGVHPPSFIVQNKTKEGKKRQKKKSPLPRWLSMSEPRGSDLPLLFQKADVVVHSTATSTCQNSCNLGMENAGCFLEGTHHQPKSVRKVVHVRS